MAIATLTLTENGGSFQITTDDVIIVQTISSQTVVTAIRGSGAGVRDYIVNESAATIANSLGLTQLLSGGVTVYVNGDNIITSGTDFIDINWDGNTKRLFDTTIVTNVVGEPKIYKALLTQTGTSAPVATVFTNTLGGTPVWTRTSAGTYTATLASAFPANKTALSFGQTYATSTHFYRNDPSVDELILVTKNVAGAATDELLFETLVLIEVY